MAIDKDGFPIEAQHGRKPYQRMKAYFIMRALQKYTDEENVMSANDLVDELNAIGVSAEKKSVYKDIEEINIYYNLIQGESEDPDEIAEGLKTGEFEKVIHYDEHKKGFYFKDLNKDFEDYRLIAEAIYCAKFVSKDQAERLVNLACENLSQYGSSQIMHKVSNLDSKKTNNKDTFFNITAISNAMSLDLYGEPHEPCKISFRYLKHEINLFRETVEKKNGLKYVVSPYELIINEGNYYLRAFDDASQQMRTFRLDRMRQVKVLEGQAREGAEVATADKHNYEHGVFGMFSGEKQEVKLQFVMSLLDPVAEKLPKETKYQRIDDHHFSALTEIEISPQFFSWICGFGKRAVIISPEAVKSDFKKFIDDIKENY